MRLISYGENNYFVKREEAVLTSPLLSLSQALFILNSCQEPTSLNKIFLILSLFSPQTVDGRGWHFRQQQIVLSQVV